MLGYMTAREALSHGFTHHGHYYGIPLWLAPDDPDFPVATKWEPLEHLMTLFHYIEQFLKDVVFTELEPGFNFYVGPPIIKEAQ